MPRCKAPEILRNEAYLDVRRNDEDEGNAADGRFSEPDRRIGGYRVACERNLLGHTRVCHFLGLVRHRLRLIRAEGLFLFRVMRLGKPENRFDSIGQRIKTIAG